MSGLRLIGHRGTRAPSARRPGRARAAGASGATRAGDYRARQLFAATPIPTFIWQRRGDDWVLLDANPAAAAFSQGSLARFVGRAAREAYRDRPDILADVERCWAERATIRREVRWTLSIPGVSAMLVVTYAFAAPDLMLVHTEDITDRVRTEEALRASEVRLRSVYNAMACGVIEVDASGAVTAANAAAQRILGAGLAGMQQADGTGASPYVGADGSPLAREHVPPIVALRTGQAQRHALIGIERPDGRCWLDVDAVPVPEGDGPARQVVISFMDVTERREAEEALRQSEERFRALSEHATDLIGLLDADGTVRYASPSYRTVLGYTPEEVVGQHAFALTHPDDVPGLQAAFEQLVRGGDRTGTAEFRIRRRDGEWRTAEVVGVNRLDDPAVRGIIATTRDITARKQAEAALRHQATHDPLTDLPNRALLQERLERALEEARRAGGTLGLLLLDLDRFKEINDTFGHQQGDALLRRVAERLREALGSGDLAARLGGDEFAVLVGDGARAATVARALLAALEAPLPLGEHVVHLGASVGIARYPEHGADAGTLLRHADVAMYEAKRERSGHAVYDPARDHHNPERLTLIRELREAIAAGGLALHYQPQVEVGSGRLRGVEALARWPHPVRGPIPPDRFVPLAEQAGLIAPLTAWVLEAAVRQQAAWRRAGLRLAVSVNLSVWDVLDPALPERVARLLRAHGVPAAALRLELTEGTLMADPARAAAALGRLRGLGVGLSVDDFGAGYSSLAYLKRLPVDELKIDRGFVRQLGTDAADAAIVASTVGLGHALGLRVVAEGVEDGAGWARLAALGCDVGQGYHLARPLPAADLARWLRESPWARPGAQMD